MPDPISSPANPRIKALVRLRNRREREATGRFLIEGEVELNRAVAAGVSIDEIYLRTPGDAGREATSAAPAATVYEVAPDAFEKAAVRGDSVLAVARKFDTSLSRLTPEPAPLVLVAAGIEKPGNLGAIIRTATATAADAVIVADAAADVFSPNVIRSSLGSVFMVPIGVAATADAKVWLDTHGIPWLSSSAQGTTSLWEADLTGPVALVVGSEASGLGPEWRTDHDLRIPTPGAVHSLNASVAAAVLLFEAARQRRAVLDG